jgi:hypothetical protein
MNLLNIKKYQARALLIHHRWRIDGIYDSLDKGRECMLRNAGIVLQENNSMVAAGSTTPWRTVTCKVCFEEFSMAAVSTMDCGHCFCNDCEFHVPPQCVYLFICIDALIHMSLFVYFWYVSFSMKFHLANVQFLELSNK